MALGNETGISPTAPSAGHYHKQLGHSVECQLGVVAELRGSDIPHQCIEQPDNKYLNVNILNAHNLFLVYRAFVLTALFPEATGREFTS